MTPDFALADILRKVDYTLLKKQKMTLLEVITQKDKEGDEETVDNLTGILHLIDAIQDGAVEHLGLDEHEVFHFTGDGS